MFVKISNMYLFFSRSFMEVQISCGLRHLLRLRIATDLGKKLSVWKRCRPGCEGSVVSLTPADVHLLNGWQITSN